MKFKISVAINNVNPNAKADWVFGLSNSWSPTSIITIWVVIVVVDSKGLIVRFAARPAAITTIIVSPIALDTANNMDPIIPGNAAGITTFFIVSDFVAPTAYEPSLNDWGTELITSSDRDETYGIIIIPIINPAAKALSEETVSPKFSPTCLKNGPTVNAAKKP